jgi:membrane-bound metal-dependent hydrolase YbcI (DUF457 family)
VCVNNISMLGKDHINISIAFILTFIAPLIFLQGMDMVYPVVLLMAVLIGSLLPDSDCKGKATLYYRYPLADTFMRKIIGKSIIFIFNHLISKKKITTEHEIKDEHRGVIHSPIGVLLSSFILVLAILIFSIIFGLFSWKIILIIFVGLIVGQFLHLYEDSCTISGINWGFPFKTRELKGSIRTFNRKDQRPKVFAWMFYFLFILIAIGYSLDILTKIHTILVYLMVLVYNSIALFLMRVFSK